MSVESGYDSLGTKFLLFIGLIHDKVGQSGLKVLFWTC